MVCLLALDCATTTGFAHGVIGDRPLSGTIRFAKPGAIDEEVWAEATRWLIDMLKIVQPDVVALEAPILTASSHGGSNTKTMGRLLGLQAVLRNIVYLRLGRPARLINVQSARKFMIGHGNLPGPEAKARVKRRCINLGWADPVDDYDRTDALCVFAKAAGDLDPGFAANFTELARAA